MTLMAKPKIQPSSQYEETVALMVPFGCPSVNLPLGLVEGIKKGLKYGLEPSEMRRRSPSA